METRRHKTIIVAFGILLAVNLAILVVFANETYRLVAEVSLFNQQFDPSWGMPAVAMGAVAAMSTLIAYRYRQESRRTAITLGGLASFLSTSLMAEAAMDYRLVPFALWSLLIAIPPMTCVLVIGLLLPPEIERAD